MDPATKDTFGWVDFEVIALGFGTVLVGIMRAFGDSLPRLARERMDICYIRDIDVLMRGYAQSEVAKQAMEGAWKTLSKLWHEGVVSVIGVDVNKWQVCRAALEARDLDCLLRAGRYTLLAQEAEDSFLPIYEVRRAAVGGGCNAGSPATGTRRSANCNYAPASQEVLDRMENMEVVCARYKVPLPAAALQFVMALPAIASFPAGTRTVAQPEQNLNWFAHETPADFCADLKHAGLLRADAPVPT